MGFCPAPKMISNDDEFLSIDKDKEKGNEHMRGEQKARGEGLSNSSWDHSVSRARLTKKKERNQTHHLESDKTCEKVNLENDDF